MLAGQITGPCRLELLEVPTPELAADSRAELLFDPVLACLCGSDLPYFECTAEQPASSLGQSLHEMIGRVAATSGTRFEVGDLVLAVPPDHLGLWQRFVVDERRAIPIASNVPIEHALMAQPLGTVLYACRKLGSPLGKRVAVVGQGPMGQLFNGVLRSLGAEQIIACDPIAERLAVSRRMGATQTLCVGEDDVASAVRDLTDGAGVDLVIEAVGHRDTALGLCVELARRDGEILLFGVPTDQVAGLSIRDLFMKNLSLHTSVYADFERSFPLGMQWIGEGRIDVAPIITHRYPLSDIQSAFELFAARRDGAIKVLIDFPPFEVSP